MVREFDGHPAATNSTRVLRLPGFANKKYEKDFYVQALAESSQTYNLRDFKLQFDSLDAPRHRQLLNSWTKIGPRNPKSQQLFGCVFFDLDQSGP